MKQPSPKQLRANEKTEALIRTMDLMVADALQEMSGIHLGIFYARLCAMAENVNAEINYRYELSKRGEIL